MCNVHSPPLRGGECVVLDHSSIPSWTSLAPPGLKNCILGTMAVFESTKWSALGRPRPHLGRDRGRVSAGFRSGFVSYLFLLATPRGTRFATGSLPDSPTRGKIAYY